MGLVAVQTVANDLMLTWLHVPDGVLCASVWLPFKPFCWPMNRLPAFPKLANHKLSYLLPQCLTWGSTVAIATVVVWWHHWLPFYGRVESGLESKQSAYQWLLFGFHVLWLVGMRCLPVPCCGGRHDITNSGMASPLGGSEAPRCGAVCGGSLTTAGPFCLLPITLAPFYHPLAKLTDH